MISLKKICNSLRCTIIRSSSSIYVIPIPRNTMICLREWLEAGCDVSKWKVCYLCKANKQRLLHGRRMGERIFPIVRVDTFLCLFLLSCDRFASKLTLHRIFQSFYRTVRIWFWIWFHLQHVFLCIHRYVEHGLIAKNVADMNLRLNLITKESLGKELRNRNQRRPLSVQNLHGLFVLWIIGLFISCIVFIVEITYPRIKKILKID